MKGVDRSISSQFVTVEPEVRREVLEVIDAPNARRFIFLSNEADLIYGMRAFLRGLP